MLRSQERLSMSRRSYWRTGNLDNHNAWEIMKLLEEINSRGTTVVVVTHNLEIVKAMNKRVITMKKGVVVEDSEGDYSDED